ncbi:MAG: NADH-quinone oxidoreductase subunit NuoN [Candidatus Latescibacteria bacterium]|nr:NADH-quinone oxidoreductase subunit NuoN [Candidatus Latescibacterota bacterium]NIM22006.1 NADH-quinone oxidoreductase subunit NuoN [Candidatus Latescibacterota bacterium]NIM66024.1 NADH-quinone oxidoreductase subunit NuoN [Candidatus Latescibacterota bacterium]NIO02432.1 NADH-quinone oxidoreductase subunit NuoN [Candidatus Latescibacterota bacterium]NIO29343.1 NADH-quinone oxidoreductase subunit NuoN [Candidatus Latescibacterota bacterium]
MISPPPVNTEILNLLAPLLVLVGAGLLFLMFGAFRNRVGTFQRALIVILYAAVLFYVGKLWNAEGWPILNGMLIIDRFSLFFTAVVTICALGSVLTSANYLDRFGLDRSEYFALLFFATSGMVVLVSAYNLISLFLGLELMSLSVYVLVGYRRRDFFANEAALKYFLLGAFAIAFFLYGVSMIYGLTGTTNFKGIMVEATSRGIARDPLFLLAVALILAGFAFKISSVPFHMWVPDVYQGAPTPITSLMATAVKAASFAAFLRLFYMCFMMGSSKWSGIIAVLAVLTMTLGNIVALVQRNIKRMMAYSSIAHAGYILIGLASLSIESTRAASSILYYLLAYSFMTIGAFALISAVEKREGTRGLDIAEYAGLGLKKPFLGLAMAVFMFSLAGIPPTAGFFGKYYIFSAAVEGGHVGLAIIGVLNSALSLYYYLRVLVVMYMQKGVEPLDVHDDLGVKVVLLVSLFAILWLGFGPERLLPGVESILEWTRVSVAKIASLGM